MKLSFFVYVVAVDFRKRRVANALLAFLKSYFTLVLVARTCRGGQSGFAVRAGLR